MTTPPWPPTPHPRHPTDCTHYADNFSFCHMIHLLFLWPHLPLTLVFQNHIHVTQMFPNSLWHPGSAICLSFSMLSQNFIMFSSLIICFFSATLYFSSELFFIFVIPFFEVCSLYFFFKTIFLCDHIPLSYYSYIIFIIINVVIFYQSKLFFSFLLFYFGFWFIHWINYHLVE